MEEIERFIEETYKNNIEDTNPRRNNVEDTNRRDFNECELETVITNDPCIGRYISKGSANNSRVYLGPRNGVYYINSSNRPSYLNDYQKLFSVVYF